MFCHMCCRLPQTDTNTVFNTPPPPPGNLTPVLTKRRYSTSHTIFLVVITSKQEMATAKYSITDAQKTNYCNIACMYSC
jgi:hypothetical protein